MEKVINVDEFLPIIDLITKADRKHEGGNLWLTVLLPPNVELSNYSIEKYFDINNAVVSYTNTKPIKRELYGMIKDKDVSDFIASELSKRATRTIIENQ